MLWIGIAEALSVASIGGLVGGCLIAISNKQAVRIVMSRMEEVWNDDMARMKTVIELTTRKVHSLENKLLTNSVINSVGNARKHYANNGYKNQRPVNQRG